MISQESPDPALVRGFEVLGTMSEKERTAGVVRLTLGLVGHLARQFDVTSRPFARVVDGMMFALAEVSECSLARPSRSRARRRALALATAARRRLPGMRGVDYAPEHDPFVVDTSGRLNANGLALGEAVGLYFGGDESQAISKGLSALNEAMRSADSH